MSQASVPLPDKQRARLMRWIEKYGPVATARAAGCGKSWVYTVLQAGSTSPRAMERLEALREEDVAAMERAVRDPKIDMGVAEAARFLDCTRAALLQRLHRMRRDSPTTKRFTLDHGIQAIIGDGYRWTMRVPESVALRGTPEPVPPPEPETPKTQPEFFVAHTQAVADSLQRQVHAEALRQKLSQADKLVRAWQPIVSAAEAAILGGIPFAEAYRKLDEAVRGLPEDARPSVLVIPL